MGTNFKQDIWEQEITIKMEFDKFMWGSDSKKAILYLFICSQYFLKKYLSINICVSKFLLAVSGAME